MKIVTDGKKYAIRKGWWPFYQYYNHICNHWLPLSYISSSYYYMYFRDLEDCKKILEFMNRKIIVVNDNG